MFDFKNASNDDLKIQYKRIAKEMGDDSFFTKKELMFLPKILVDNEQVLGFVSGLMNGSTWLVSLTDKRIIFLDKGLVYGLKRSIVNLDKVNTVSGSTGLVFGQIIITDGANDILITNVLKATVGNFTNKVQDALDARNSLPSVQVAEVDDPYGDLIKISELRDKGIISEDEFQVEKKKILGSTKDWAEK